MRPKQRRRGEAIDWQGVRQRLARATAAMEESLRLSPERARAVLAERARALARAPDEAARAAGQIVASAGQQATGMAQIHQAMKNIDQVARQNLAAMRQAEQAAQNLNALGTRLAELGGS
jgi:methyl-accepting chemotaxis protein